MTEVTDLLWRWLEETEKWVYVFEQNRLSREAMLRLEIVHKSETERDIENKISQFQDSIPANLNYKTDSIGPLFRSVNEEASSTDDKIEAAQLWIKLSMFIVNEGNLEQAEKTLRKVRPPQVTDSHYIGIASWMIGCLYWNWKQPDRGTREWEAAQQAFTQAKQGKVDSQRAWYDDKLRLMNEALKQAKKLGSLPPLIAGWSDPQTTGSMIDSDLNPPPTGSSVDSHLTLPTLRLHWPATSRKIIQRFGELSELYQQYNLPGREGISFFAQIGDPVYAAAEGVVKQAEQPQDHPYGLQVRIRHRDGEREFETIYAHLSEALVKAGDTVRAGQMIAKAGQSGVAVYSGPFLHFKLIIDGESTPGYPAGIVDPEPYLEPPTGTPTVEPEPVPELLEGLEHEQPQERLAAVQRLAGYVVSSADTRHRLRIMLEDPDVAVRLAAGAALLPVLESDQEARGDFLRHLDPDQEVEPVRAGFLLNLAGQAKAKWARDELVKRVSDGQAGVRLAAIEALAGLAPTYKTVEKALQKAVADPDPQVQAAARQALRQPTTPPADRPVPQRLAIDALDKTSVADQPLTSIEQDALGFKPYVLALKDFITSESTGTPLTIGVDGTWGSGKSSLMGMLKSQLDPPPNSKEARQSKDERRAWWRKSWRLLPRLAWAGFVLKRYPAPTRGEPDNRPYWVRVIAAGMAYDETVHKWEEVEAWEAPRARRWAKTRKRAPLMRPAFPAVWFNAWKFDQEEQVWAALALEVTNQLKARYGRLERLRFWWGLTWRRFKPWEAVWMIVRKFLVPALLILAYLAYMNLADSDKNPLPAPLDEYSGYLLLLGALVVGYINVSKVLKDPFQINVKELTRTPDYQGKIGFIGQFQEDFKCIVAQATRQRFGWRQSKLVIFIDDLDRCEPPKAANIVEAINIFLDSPGCVFILGMDMRAVVASIEIKYKDVFARMQQQEQALISPGRIFLDKIVQVPIHLPQPAGDAILKLVEQVTQPLVRTLAPPVKPEPPVVESRAEQRRETGAPAESGPAETPAQGEAGQGKIAGTPAKEGGSKERTAKDSMPAFTQGRPDVGSVSREEIQAAIQGGVRLLGDNPRQAKRFVNLFRLHVYIADQNQLLERRGKRDSNLATLATWVAFSLRYTEASQSLLVEVNQEEQRKYLAELAENIKQVGADFRLENYDSEITRLVVEREKVKEIPSHWWRLPWHIWMQESDFCQAVRELEGIWALPAAGQDDWLVRLIRMSAVAG